MDIKFIQNISAQDANYLAEEQEFFTVVINDVAKRDPMYLKLVAFFKDKSVSEMLAYKDTYFKWYVYLNWKNFQSLSFPDVLLACANQIPTAFSLGIDVLNELMWYLALRTQDVFEVESWYSKMKQSIFQSPLPLGNFQGKQIILRDIIVEIEKINQSQTDSIARAEFNAKLKNLLFPTNQFANKYIVTEFTPDDFVAAFNSLVGFFIGIDNGRLLYILDSLQNPMKYEEEVPENIAPTAVVDYASKIENIPQIEGAISAAPSELLNSNSVSTPASPITVETPTPMSQSEIQSRIDAQFEKDENGQYKDLEGVFAALDEIASTYNDESIRELFYFDEQSGGFKWREV
jgi:hypothetical protein